MAGFFITGTDTGVGKTRAAVALMRFIQAQGFSVIGMKPVASGCFWQGGELRNDDAMQLMANATVAVDYAKLNIYAFEPPVSPNIAAQSAGETVKLESIVSNCRELEALADCVVVEGIGGWEVPLNDRQRVSDLAFALQLPVIMVVGMKLGCLNHAFLTHAAMLRSGVAVTGWVANALAADFPGSEENLKTLRSGLSSPCLGVIPFSPDAVGVEPKYFKERDFFTRNCEEILLQLRV